jgi:hypothetical protein
MSKDPTEAIRREMIKSGQPERDLAERDPLFFKRWNTDEVRELFEVHSFLAPFVLVTRKQDGVKGTLEFTHNPRWYFNFKPDNRQ